MVYLSGCCSRRFIVWLWCCCCIRHEHSGRIAIWFYFCPVRFICELCFMGLRNRLHACRFYYRQVWAKKNIVHRRYIDFHFSNLERLSCFSNTLDSCSIYWWDRYWNGNNDMSSLYFRSFAWTTSWPDGNSFSIHHYHRNCDVRLCKLGDLFFCWI